MTMNLRRCESCRGLVEEDEGNAQEGLCESCWDDRPRPCLDCGELTDDSIDRLCADCQADNYCPHGYHREDACDRCEDPDPASLPQNQPSMRAAMKRRRW